MLEQADAFCQTEGNLQVVGYYHANENLKDVELKPFARRIADRIQQRCPKAVVLLVRGAAGCLTGEGSSAWLIAGYACTAQRRVPAVSNAVASCR